MTSGILLRKVNEAVEKYKILSLDPIRDIYRII